MCVVKELGDGRCGPVHCCCEEGKCESFDTKANLLPYVQPMLAIYSHFFIAMVEGRGQNVQLKQNGYGVNNLFPGTVGQLSSLLFRHENGALMQPNVAQYTNIHKFHKQLLHFTIHK